MVPLDPGGQGGPGEGAEEGRQNGLGSTWDNIRGETGRDRDPHPRGEEVTV